MEIIWLIIVILFIASTSKNSKKKLQEQTNKAKQQVYSNKPSSPIPYSKYKEVNTPDKNREVSDEMKRAKEQMQQRRNQEDQLEKARAKVRAEDEYQRKVRESQNQEKLHQEGLKKQKDALQRQQTLSSSAILNRSKANVAEESEDRTKNSREEEGRREFSSGNHYQPNVEEGSVLDEVYEVMITGYQSKLSYERDFLGEGMDMLNHIQLVASAGNRQDVLER